MRRSKHLVRALLVCILALGGFLVVRAFFIPPSYGLTGGYRFADVPAQRAKPMIHGGNASCEPCHADQPGLLKGGVHATLSCEACHAPVTTHADPTLVKSPEKGKIAEMPVNKSWEACARCHLVMDARPKDHPMIDVTEHLEEMDTELSDEACLECHDPHSPSE